MLFRKDMTVLIEITFKWLDAGMGFIKRKFKLRSDTRYVRAIFQLMQQNGLQWKETGAKWQLRRIHPKSGRSGNDLWLTHLSCPFHAQKRDQSLARTAGIATWSPGKSG